jgi:hypothetical protein
MDARAALRTCADPANLRRTLLIAAVVGCILSMINEGGAIVRAHIQTATGVKIGLNFVVPFLVSNLGVLTATRSRRD